MALRMGNTRSVTEGLRGPTGCLVGGSVPDFDLDGGEAKSVALVVEVSRGVVGSSGTGEMVEKAKLLFS
jgi:hypothetical protein